MNNHIWQVFTYELKRNLRRKGFLFATFGIPFIGYLIFFGFQFFSQQNADPEPEETSLQEQLNELFREVDQAGYVDMTNTFADPGELGSHLTRYEDEAAAQAALQAGEIETYYVIAADYVETGEVTQVLPRMDFAQVTSAPIRRLILDHYAEGLDEQLFDRLVDPADFREVDLGRDASGETEVSFDNDFLLIYIFAFALLMSVFITNGYLMQTVIEEKETRIIEILISSMNPTSLLAGKIFALGLLGLFQVIVWLTAILLLGQIAAGQALEALAAFANLSLNPVQLAVFLIYFVLGYLFFAACYGAVGALATSMQEGPGYAVIFTLPAALPFYLIGLFTTNPNDSLPTLLSLFPITAPLSMVMRIALVEVPWWQIALSVTLLLLADIGMIWLAGRLFRVQSLLAGQVPKPRELLRLLRG
jgi:ABC-2 type transport system permease protein